MRESLTIFAGLLILILTVALVGPYFVDWTAQRGWVEKLLSDAIGAPVEVAGAIDLKLLPTPSLRLEKVVMGGTAPGEASFKADRLELQMAVSPLMRGEVQFIQANFEAPEVHFTLGADGGIVLPHAPAALPAAMQFSAISLRHGRLSFDDPSNKRSFSIDAVNLDAQADSLIGPFKGSGNFARVGGGAIAFDFSTATLQDGALSFKASFDPTSTTPASDIAGALDFSTAAGGATRVSFNGTAAISGVVAIPGAAPLPWRVATPVAADAHHANFTALDLHIGDVDHALAATGTAEIDWAGAPRAQTSLSAQQIDLDALLTPKDGGRFDAKPLVQALSRVLADPGSARRLPIPLTISFDTPALTLGGETLTQIAGKLDMRSGAPIGIDLKADGPGRSHLALAGSVETGPAAGYDGHAEASFADKTRLADWLLPAFPEIASRLRELPVRRFDLSGNVDASAAGFSGRDLRIGADQSKFGGTLAFTRALGGERARLFADLSADALDLDALPDLSGPSSALADADLELKFDARAVRVARFGQGVVDAGHIRLELSKTGQRAVLKNLSIANLGGANVTATGLATPDALRFEANLDADRLGDLAALLRRVTPGPAADLLAARATALSPAHLELTAAATKANGSSQLSGLILTGTARGTQITASANPDPTDPQAISAKVTLDSADTPMLLRQFGMQTVPISAFGRSHVGLTLQGRVGDDFGASLEATLADTNFGFQGRVGGGSGALNGAGSFTVKGANFAPLMQIAAVGLPDATIGLPIDLAGKLNFDNTKITVADLAGKLAGTSLKGEVTDNFAAASGGATLTGALAFDRLPV
ncbi:MAG TPA: AsmA family protein, partial [Beijerinckiaceae bacterium]|nr:AsmA family protein [Beijerinckiaceae bacterium]